MKAFLKNPITVWLLWFLTSRRILYKNRKKNLRIGYMTRITNTKLGKFNTFYDNVIVSNSCVGDYVYIAGNTQISNAKIGKFCSIGPAVKIGLGMHPTNYISTFPAFFSIRKQCQVTFVDKNYFEEIGKVEIGNDVWIGYNATILDNIKIGDGAIIAAGAVVTKDVEPYTIVGGVPARVIKKRFSDVEIEKLLKIKWWDNDEHWLRENAKLFISKNEFFKS